MQDKQKRYDESDSFILISILNVSQINRKYGTCTRIRFPHFDVTVQDKPSSLTNSWVMSWLRVPIPNSVAVQIPLAYWLWYKWFIGVSMTSYIPIWKLQRQICEIEMTDRLSPQTSTPSNPESVCLMNRSTRRVLPGGPLYAPTDLSIATVFFSITLR